MPAWHKTLSTPCACRSFARERAKVNHRNFTGIPAGARRAFDSDPAKLKSKFHRVEHTRRISPAHSSFPVRAAALLSADGLGDFASSMLGHGSATHAHRRRDRIPPFARPSITRVTQYLGSVKFGDEYKVMGLPPTGQPRTSNPFATSSGSATTAAISASSRHRLLTHHKTGPECPGRIRPDAHSRQNVVSDITCRVFSSTRAASPMNRSSSAIATWLPRSSEARRGYLGMLQKLAARRARKPLPRGESPSIGSPRKIFDATAIEKVYVHRRRGCRPRRRPAYYIWHQSSASHAPSR